MKKFTVVTLILIGIYLAVPILATAMYAFSTEWNQTILPEGFTFKWIGTLFQDDQFLKAFGRSVLLSGGAVLISILFIVPAILVISLYFPALEKWFQAGVVMVYAFPGVILSVGLIKFYSGTSLPMVLAVLGVYVITVLPYMYQGTRNSLRNVNGRQLMDAAELLGASKIEAFRKVLFPSIYPGLFVAALLSFSILFGEFVLINLVVGSRFETVQIYLMKKLNTSGHIASAVVFVYLVLMGMLTLVVATLTKKAKGMKGA
ncbi:putative spermidine/putrescine transport system permease protein [Bacillus ectoiniformans]|uniref:ABC transporter permease n=1 Tax=Bacillus ectoiniformans TaxID=1494429 RepID=UPI001958FC59|nr:ABC transporter permease subunit [Bacillus ectoiniformans]MBM7647478.1 putative spermidine/putrescine transport system permease protein [Bacillus ectoiniformans]